MDMDLDVRCEHLQEFFRVFVVFERYAFLSFFVLFFIWFMVALC